MLHVPNTYNDKIKEFFPSFLFFCFIIETPPPLIKGVGRGFPKLEKQESMRFAVKMGVSKMGDALYFFAVLNNPDWRPFVIIKFCI